MYRLKIAGMDQVSFGPAPVLMAVKIKEFCLIDLLHLCINVKVFFMSPVILLALLATILICSLNLRLL